MCGINAILDFQNNFLDKQKLVEKMNRALFHRGPDDTGIWENENKQITFGHQRLSILDLSSNGHQPMLDPKTGNVIVFNGEIYNFKELKIKYLKEENFVSQSDTEIVLKLYEKLGEKMLPLLNGMFVILIWNNEKNELFVARDLSGKKPLYFTQKNHSFIFSSELKAILELPFIEKKMDEKAFYNYLTFNISITPHSMFEGIEKFKPGYYAIFNKNGIQDYKCFKKIEKIALNFKKEQDLVEQIQSRFSESVKLRMLADVPVGLFLSGGVDSSGILAEMSKNTQKTISTFTIGFEQQENYNELIFAEKVAKQFNSKHFVKIVKKEDLLNFLPKITEIYDELQADTTAIPIYFISELAKENGIKVVLNGDGADELFAGYNSFNKYTKYYSYFKILAKSPYFVRKISGDVLKKTSKNELIHEFSERLVNKQDFFWSGASGLKASQKNHFLSKEFYQQSESWSSYLYIENLLKNYTEFSKGKYDFIEWMCFSSYHQAVIERFLFRADRLGMANSIEARSPFLDDSFVSFALSIPSEYKIKNNVPKYILKKALEKNLSADILYRKKMGFCLPLKEWAGETIIRDFEQILPHFTNNTNYFNKTSLFQLVSDFKNGKTNNINQIWSIYFFMKWYQKWM